MTNPFKKMLIKSVIIASVFVLIGLFWTIPSYFRIKEQNLQIRHLAEDHARILKMVLPEGRVKERLDEIRVSFNYYKGMIPQHEKLSGILNEIASMAQKHRMEVLLIKPLRDQEYLAPDKNNFKDGGREVREIIIQVKAEGQYFQLGEYLAELEKVPYKVIIKSVKAESPRRPDMATDQEPKLSVDLMMSILMMMPVKAAPAK